MVDGCDFATKPSEQLPEGLGEGNEARVGIEPTKPSHNIKNFQVSVKQQNKTLKNILDVTIIVTSFEACLHFTNDLVRVSGAALSLTMRESGIW
jgi:hypothetical protein